MKTRSAVPLPVPRAKKIDLRAKPRAAARVEKLPGFQVGQQVPQAYSRLLLYLSDGTALRGVWTGEKWWAEGGQVFPERWELASNR